MVWRVNSHTKCTCVLRKNLKKPLLWKHELDTMNKICPLTSSILQEPRPLFEQRLTADPRPSTVCDADLPSQPIGQRNPGMQTIGELANHCPLSRQHCIV